MCIRDSALDRLVTVSSMCYHTSTSVLSTSSSSRGLTTVSYTHLDVYKRQTSTWTWIDHPVSGLLRLTMIALFRLGFPSAPGLWPLTSPASVTRRTVLQKVRGCTYIVLPQFVNIWFQVLFHSPPGVLFTLSLIHI